jgi:hypothetical protein
MVESIREICNYKFEPINQSKMSNLGFLTSDDTDTPTVEEKVVLKKETPIREVRPLERVNRNVDTVAETIAERFQEYLKQ